MSESQPNLIKEKVPQMERLEPLARDEKPFHCEALHALITPRACFANYIRAKSLAGYLRQMTGPLRQCLRCQKPKLAKVYFDVGIGGLNAY